MMPSAGNLRTGLEPRQLQTGRVGGKQVEYNTPVALIVKAVEKAERVGKVK